MTNEPQPTTTTPTVTTDRLSPDTVQPTPPIPTPTDNSVTVPTTPVTVETPTTAAVDPSMKRSLDPEAIMQRVIRNANEDSDVDDVDFGDDEELATPKSSKPTEEELREQQRSEEGKVIPDSDDIDVDALPMDDSAEHVNDNDADADTASPPPSEVMEDTNANATNDKNTKKKDVNKEIDDFNIDDDDDADDGAAAAVDDHPIVEDSDDEPIVKEKEPTKHVVDKSPSQKKGKKRSRITNTNTNTNNSTGSTTASGLSSSAATEASPAKVARKTKDDKKKGDVAVAVGKETSKKKTPKPPKPVRQKAKGPSARPGMSKHRDNKEYDDDEIQIGEGVEEDEGDEDGHREVEVEESEEEVEKKALKPKKVISKTGSLNSSKKKAIATVNTKTSVSRTYSKKDSVKKEKSKQVSSKKSSKEKEKIKDKNKDTNTTTPPATPKKKSSASASDKMKKAGSLTTGGTPKKGKTAPVKATSKGAVSKASPAPGKTTTATKGTPKGKLSSAKKAGGTPKSASKVTKTSGATKGGRTPTKKKETPKKNTKSKSKRKSGDDSDDDDEEEMAKVSETDSESESDSDGGDVDTSQEVFSQQSPSAKSAIIGSIACSTRDDNVQMMVQHATRQLGRYQLIDYNGDSDADLPLTAYVIGGGTKRGWGLLRAIAAGVPLISEDWVVQSISDGQWADMEKFKSDRFGAGGREGPSGKILEGMRVKVVCDVKEEGAVRKLVRGCGGRVAETRVDIVINDDGQNVVEGCVNVGKKWLADSVEAGVAIEYDPYVVGE